MSEWDGLPWISDDPKPDLRPSPTPGQGWSRTISICPNCLSPEPQHAASGCQYESDNWSRVEVVLASSPLPAGGLSEIAAERERQVAEEGWTPQHDDQHAHGQLVDAAVAYLDRDVTRWPFGYEGDGPNGHGSSGGSWIQGRPKLTPDDRVRELVKAGALIAAEIDRLARLVSAPTPRGTR